MKITTRGFSPVTFVFEGAVEHRDSLGNRATVTKGGTQWMHAGKGITHSERPSKTIAEEGGLQEFIQFWVMDPFNEDSENSSGGEFYFNLGNVSEDLLRDGRKAFENGLPPGGDYDTYSSELEYTSWGVVPNTQVVVNAFDNNLSSHH